MSSPIEVGLRKLGIPIYTSGNREFELSVATANFLYRYLRPQWVVRPRNGEDVATTVRLANKIGERIAVKGGGHSYAGFCNTQGGILLDLCNMNAIRIEDEGDEGSKKDEGGKKGEGGKKDEGKEGGKKDEGGKGNKKVMIASGGALWGDAYHELAIGGHDSFIVNGGRCPLVGMSGFLLGGGFGPFSRSVGMGMDQLVEVTVVTAEGDTITVRETDDPESKNGKLFWALRGCGGGNFGIVTQLKIRVEKLRDPWVVAGRLIWIVTEETLKDFKEMMVDFYTAPWENHLTIDTTWECDLTKSSDSKPFSTRFIAYYDGPEDGFAKEINLKMPNPPNPPTDPRPPKSPIEPSKPPSEPPNPPSEPPNPTSKPKVDVPIHQNFRDQLIRRSLAEQSTMFLHETLWAQWSEETRRSLPTDRAYTLYSSWVIKNDNEENIRGITKIISERIQRFRDKFTGERGTFGVTWIHIGGKISEKASNSTPYPWRQGNYCIYILVRWHEKWLVKEMGDFFEQCKAMLKPYSIGGKASYVNFPDRFLENWKEAYYDTENTNKLREIHDLWVPKDRQVLRFAQNIGHQEISAAEIAIKQWKINWEGARGTLASRGERFEDLTPQGDRLSIC